MVLITPQNGLYRKTSAFLLSDNVCAIVAKKAFRHTTDRKIQLSVFYFENFYCQYFLLFGMYKYTVSTAKRAYPLFTSEPPEMPGEKAGMKDYDYNKK